MNEIKDKEIIIKVKRLATIKATRAELLQEQYQLEKELGIY